MPRADLAASPSGARSRFLRGNPGGVTSTWAAHHRCVGTLREPVHPYDRASSGHAATLPGAAVTTVASLAVALGDAFLAAERWQRGGLVESGGRVLGVRRRWLWPLADAVLAAYPRAPRDRPRELAAFLADLALLTEVVDGARQRGQPIVVRARLVTPTRTLRRPWSTPVLDDLGDLARLLDLTPEQLDWYADRRGMNRRTDDHRLHHYRYRWAAGGRLIEAPKPRLRVLHRRLLAEVLGPLPVHPAAHGFVPGRSAYTFAAAHAGRPWWYASTWPRFSAAFRPAGCTGCCAPPDTRSPSRTRSPRSAPPGPRPPCCVPRRPTCLIGLGGWPCCAAGTCRRARRRRPRWRTCVRSGSTVG